MKPVSIAILAMAAVVVAAFPVVVLEDGTSDTYKLSRRTGGVGGFQDYVLVPGPAPFDLAGALNEIQGYGVRPRVFCCPCRSLSADLRCTHLDEWQIRSLAEPEYSRSGQDYLSCYT